MNLILGGTGFLGKSLLDFVLTYQHHDSFLFSSSSSGFIVQNQKVDVNNSLAWNVLGRSSIEGDFNLIIHAATPASAELNVNSPDLMLEQNVRAMENLLVFASQHKTPPTILFTSSGAVYKSPTFEDFRMYERSELLDLNDSAISAYAKGKIVAEEMLRDATARGVCNGIVARLFAFSGVHIPLDRHFAIGNFVRDVVTNGEIVVRSDGTSERSYLDGADMADWLLRIADVGESNEIYHVGSERAITIAQLAELVSHRYTELTSKPSSVKILGKTSPIDGVQRYVPSTERTRKLLGVAETISLEQSIDQMILKALES
jgi:dTDP-glucose 4,6-dehydratase